MTSISVYGYDTAMLIGHRSSSNDEARETSELAEPHKLRVGCTRSPFLELPYELRAKIYSYVLPSTSNVKNRGLVWNRGPPIWATNRQIHSECIGSLYGNGTFLIEVGYDYIQFIHQYRLPTSNLVAKRGHEFPEKIPARYQTLMRRFQITVKEVDSYTGMIMYNCSNTQALYMKLRQQMQQLCDFLRGLPEVRTLEILYNQEYSKVNMERIMELPSKPFRGLSNVVAFIIMIRDGRNYHKILSGVATSTYRNLDKRSCSAKSFKKNLSVAKKSYGIMD